MWEKSMTALLNVDPIGASATFTSVIFMTSHSGGGSAVDHGRGTLAMMLGAFLLTFVITRLITRLIRSGRGPFHDVEVGTLHLHHDVFGILLMIVTGTIEFAYRPPAPWVQALAVVFACGAALTLDEFALWLYLR